jgi:hypothetical protein
MMGLHQGLMARFLSPLNQADFEFPEIHGVGRLACHAALYTPSEAGCPGPPYNPVKEQRVRLKQIHPGLTFPIAD